ncbi:MAG: hypothetical protein IKN71_02540 [Alphaproteobacteria bacterium]|nr:hypothetical protein [Alphaproteobacteria bacterium]
MYGDMECAELTATLEGAVFEAAVTSQVPLEVNIGGEVQLDVGETISYVKTGIDEIEAAVSEKTAAFNLNADSKVTEYNNNAVAKTTSFNDNATVKQAAVDAGAALAQNWATKTDGTVDGSEYSARYYAGQAAEIIASADVVHKSGAETIDGAKTFLQDVAAKINYTRGIAPASTVYPKPFIIYDANGKIFACMQLLFSANKLTRAELLAYNGADSSDNSPASMGVVNNNGSKYAYAPTPTEDTAASTQIDTVGARNTKLGSYVTLAGNQEITGRKNFVGSLQNVRLKMNSDAENAYTDLAFLKNDDTRVAYIRGNSSGELGIVANKVTVPASSEANSAVNTAAISKASNGYVQLGNGVIINWGKTTVQTSSQSTTVTFSKAFSNNNGTHVATQGGGATLPKVTSINSTSFVLSRDEATASASPATYTWIAVGY